MLIREPSTGQRNVSCYLLWLLICRRNCSKRSFRVSQIGKLGQQGHRLSFKVQFTSKGHHDLHRTASGFPYVGRGTTPEKERSPIKRYTDEQLAHFIAFIQSPHITTDIPFGERKLKLSSGEKVTVPDVIRNIIPSRIVAQYLAYCEETIDAEEFKPLAPSSLFAILQKCTASTRKSLAGLDNFSSDEATAFDQLRAMCDEMATYGKRRAGSPSLLGKQSFSDILSSQA